MAETKRETADPVEETKGPTGERPAAIVASPGRQVPKVLEVPTRPFAPVRYPTFYQKGEEIPQDGLAPSSKEPVTAEAIPAVEGVRAKVKDVVPAGVGGDLSKKDLP